MQRFISNFGAMWPLTSSRHAINVVFRFEILDFDVSNPNLTMHIECSTTAIVTTEQAVLLASANTCRCTMLILFTPLATLLGTYVRFSAGWYILTAH